MTQAKVIGADYGLAPKDLKVALHDMIAAGVCPLVWGPPGIGKSDIAREVAADLGMTYIDVRALLLDPVDLRGIPWRDGNTTRWAPPEFLPPQDSSDDFLLNLEELASAPPMVQAALYQLVLDRAIGEYQLPPGAKIMACSNRESDRAVVNKMSTALASRFIHLDATISVEDWIDWALPAGIAVEVIFFLKFRPDLLMQFDPKSKEKAFPCPRTWSFISKAVDGGNTGQTLANLAVLRGAIGEGAAVEFSAFLEVFKRLPSPDAVFKDPLGVAMPDDPSVLIALSSALARQAEDHRMDALVAFAKRADMRLEIGEFMVNSSVHFNPDSRFTKAFIAWESHLNAMQ